MEYLFGRLTARFERTAPFFVGRKLVRLLPAFSPAPFTRKGRCRCEMVKF